jgi:hypothetical protein
MVDTESGQGLAILRYMPHLTAFAIVACFVALDTAVTAALPYLVVCAFALACNFGTFSYWATPMGRHAPVSWARLVYPEIFHPPPEAWDEVIDTVGHGAAASSGGEGVIVTLPDSTQTILSFYLGDRYLVPPLFINLPSLDPAAGEMLDSLQRTMGGKAYRRLGAQPKWIVNAIYRFGQTPPVPAGYVIDRIVPSYRARPDEGARPELTRHRFFEAKPVAEIVLYRWQDD